MLYWDSVQHDGLPYVPQWLSEVLLPQLRVVSQWRLMHSYILLTPHALLLHMHACMHAYAGAQITVDSLFLSVVLHLVELWSVAEIPNGNQFCAKWIHHRWSIFYLSIIRYYILHVILKCWSHKNI